MEMQMSSEKVQLKGASQESPMLKCPGQKTVTQMKRFEQLLKVEVTRVLLYSTVI